MRSMMFPTTLIDEVMAQPFYTPDEEVSFDPQPKRDPLSVSHTTQSDAAHEMVERNTGCISSGPEIDPKGRSSTRRRIQVACNRCRKRKIKCSGDVGGGQGCSNCRSSGNANCQFLRVNSEMVSGWPYPTNATASQSQRLGLYAPSAAPKMRVLPGNPPNFRVASFSRAPEYDMGVADPQNPYSRPLGIEHTIGYEDEVAASYTIHTSAYMLPSSPQALTPDLCAFTWNPKGWSPSLHSGRSPHETIFSDHDAENPLAHPAYSYMLSGQATQPSDMPSIIPTQSALSSSTQGGERTLPNPATRNPVQVNVGALTTSSDITSGPQAAHDYRLGNRWIQKSDPRTFMQTTSLESLTAGTVTRPKMIPSSVQDMVFGFLPMASTGAPSPLMPSSSGKFAAMETSVNPADGLRGATDSRLARKFSRDNAQLLSLANYTSETYGHSSSEKSYKSRSAGVDDSSDILLNGMQYTRPNPHLAPSLPDTFSDFRPSPDIHRTPVTGLSNPGGF